MLNRNKKLVTQQTGLRRSTMPNLPVSEDHPIEGVVKPIKKQTL